MEHAISRSALQSPASTPEAASDPEINVRLNRYTDFEYVDHHAPAPNHDDEEELDFRLFATKNLKRGQEPSKVRLKSPTPTITEPGFIGLGRPTSYYLTASTFEDFTETAVTGKQILAASAIPWPGCAYPWNVTSLPAAKADRNRSAHEGRDSLHLTSDGDLSKRTRPGKAYRIRLRTKLAAERHRSETARTTAEKNEVAEREKRARRNREKKAKKKLREKAKKAGVAQNVAQAQDAGDEDGSASE